MVSNQIINLLFQCCENGLIRRYKGTFSTITARKILRCNHRDTIAGKRLHQQYFAVVVGKICSLNHLVDKRPEFERLVGGLVVEHKIELFYPL